MTRKTGGGKQTRMNFKFDEVLSSYSSQEDVFACTLQPLVGQVLAGYEATTFAYGQTGTGKTYTMEGDTSCEEDRGLMPRAAAAVLDALNKGKYAEFQVSVSYLEIYNEELGDLLAPANHQPKLDLLDTGDSRGVCCVGLSDVPVSTVEDILRLVSAAQERRRVAETRINARSSRSHCIFTMKVLCRRNCPGGEQETIGKLHLVDLAGSECAKKAQIAAGEEAIATPRDSRPGSQVVPCAAEQERERRNINQSLLTLRRVITALREKSGRVPYRDSKLTRLLKDALGGSCRTVVIATISPALAVVEETISTLTYAEHAAGIQNRPVASSMLRMPSGGVICDNYGDLTPAAMDASSELDMKVAYLSQEVEECQGALARKQQEVQELTERAEGAEEELEESRLELQKAHEDRAKSEAERERMAASVTTMSEELASIVDPLTSSREELLAKLAKLGNEDAVATEGSILQLLKSQREALQAEVADVRSALDGARAELVAARGEVADVRSGQAKSRSATLEAIMALARRELDSLGGQLDSAASAVGARLEKSEAFTDAAGDSVVSAEGRSAAAGTDVVKVAEQWAKDIASGCNGIARASGESMQATERRLGSLTERLHALGEGISKDAVVREPVTIPREAHGQTEPEQDKVAPNERERLAVEWDSRTAKENVETLVSSGQQAVKPAAALAQKAKPGRVRLLREVN